MNTNFEATNLESAPQSTDETRQAYAPSERAASDPTPTELTTTPGAESGDRRPDAALPYAALPDVSLLDEAPPDVAKPWRFEATREIDAPYHALATYFGRELIDKLDEIVFDTPVGAVTRATKIFQEYSQKLQSLAPHQDLSAMTTKEVMQLFARSISSHLNVMDQQALVPAQAVFRG